MCTDLPQVHKIDFEIYLDHSLPPPVMKTCHIKNEFHLMQFH